jgi:hypothetical protein
MIVQIRTKWKELIPITALKAHLKIRYTYSTNTTTSLLLKKSCRTQELRILGQRWFREVKHTEIEKKTPSLQKTNANME